MKTNIRLLYASLIAIIILLVNAVPTMPVRADDPTPTATLDWRYPQSITQGSWTCIGDVPLMLSDNAQRIQCQEPDGGSGSYIEIVFSSNAPVSAILTFNGYYTGDDTVTIQCDQSGNWTILATLTSERTGDQTITELGLDACTTNTYRFDHAAAGDLLHYLFIDLFVRAEEATPTPTNNPTPTSTDTPTFTPTSTFTLTPSSTATETFTPTSTYTPTSTRTLTTAEAITATYDSAYTDYTAVANDQYPQVIILSIICGVILMALITWGVISFTKRRR